MIIDYKNQFSLNLQLIHGSCHEKVTHMAKIKPQVLCYLELFLKKFWNNMTNSKAYLTLSFYCLENI